MMPPRAKLYNLSEEDRKWLDAELVKNGFGSYTQLSEELKRRGYEISRCAVHRYGMVLQKKIDAIRGSYEAALAINQAVADEPATLSDSVVAMVQAEMFRTLLTLGTDGMDQDMADRLKALSGVATSKFCQSDGTPQRRSWQNQAPTNLVSPFAANVGDHDVVPSFATPVIIACISAATRSAVRP